MSADDTIGRLLRDAIKVTPPPPPNDPRVATIIREGEEHVAIYLGAQQKTRDAIIPLADGLFEARKTYSADRDFGAWLTCSPYREIEKDDRAALIHIGQHREFAIKFLKHARYTSPETIWNAMRDLLPVSELPKPTVEGKSSPTSVDSAAPTTEIDEKVEADLPKSSPEKGKVSIKLTRNSKLYGRKRADEVTAIFVHKHARRTLGNMMQSRAWKMILQALDGGLLPTATDASIERPTMRFVFPYGSGAYCNRYDLTDSKDRGFVASILPRMIEMKDRLLAEPDRLEAILNQDRREREKQAQAAVIAERVQRAVAALPSSETEVIMFGKRLWPLVPGETVGVYDFKTLQVAIWKFTDLNRWLTLGDKDPHGRAIMIRNSTKWDRHFIGELIKAVDADLAARIDRVYSLVHALCSMMEQNPTGECREPMTPLVLG